MPSPIHKMSAFNIFSIFNSTKSNISLSEPNGGASKPTILTLGYRVFKFFCNPLRTCSLEPRKKCFVSLFKPFSIVADRTLCPFNLSWVIPLLFSSQTMGIPSAILNEKLLIIFSNF